MYKKSLCKRYLESISSQAASLSLSNISRFYISYVNNNKQKVEAELNRVGYYILKNKLSIGNSSTTTKDIFISTYFCNEDMTDECNRMLYQKYHGEADIRTTGGFFVPSTNELVIIIKINMDEPIEYSVKNSDFRSTIEHEITHAFDHTSKNKRLAEQDPLPGVGENFLSACAYLGCASRSDIAEIIGMDLFTGGAVSSCIYSISIVLYKLFTITEFNAHQMSDLEELHKVDIKRSNELKKALAKDIVTDTKLTAKYVTNAISIDADTNPELWHIVGNVLRYLGYKVSESPSAVYRFFKRMSDKLFKKYLSKKIKNQVKSIISLREKNSIKLKLADCINRGMLDSGISFWFSPSGNSDSFLCRVNARNNKILIAVNRKPVKIIGNADGILKRAVDALNSSQESKFDFAVDNLVDVIVQSIERNFNNVSYDPVYDITEPQDEDQAYKSNKVTSRFADLDWD